ncbi:MAG: hypothetical protein MZV65_00310 [Chromatiales bacterium]|nr:hypothetical protein [Chromatiales bacterium]
MEAFSCYNIANALVPPLVCNQTGLTLPVASYDHTSGNCSVTGGFVYRGFLQPELRGTYLHSDFCSGRIWGLRRSGGIWQHVVLTDTPFNVSTFGEDELGELYLADLTPGNVHRVIIPRLSSGKF